MIPWLESDVSSPIEDLVAEAKGAGVQNQYAFAEWLIQTKEHFGDYGTMDICQMESCYDEAIGWWEIGNKAQ